MESDLYSLPKDMLVKLIATIREDTIKEISKKYEDQMKDLQIRYDLMKEVSDYSTYPISVEQCSFPNCEAMWGSNGRDTDSYYKCDDRDWCESCGKMFCQQHIIIDSNNIYCDNCIINL